MRDAAQEEERRLRDAAVAEANELKEQIVHVTAEVRYAHHICTYDPSTPIDAFGTWARSQVSATQAALGVSRAETVGSEQRWRAAEERTAAIAAK